VAVEVCLWAVVAWLATDGTDAAERLRRSISDLHGVPAGAYDVAQDREGFIWIAGGEGLARFDGQAAVPWAQEVIGEALEYVETGLEGEVCAGTGRGGLYEIAGASAQRVLGPGGVPIDPARHAAFDRDGALWVITDGRLMRRLPDGAWHTFVESTLGGERGRSLLRAERGGMIVGTRQGGVWHVGPDGSTDSLARDLGGSIGFMDIDDGAVVALARGTGVVRIDRGEVEVLLRQPELPTGLAISERAIWVSFTGGVYRVLLDGGPLEALTPADGFIGGSNTFVDRDGGLWVTSYRGIDFYPEPATTIWTRLGDSSRFRVVSVRPVRGGHWAATWEGGAAFLRDGALEWKLLPIDEFSAHYGCPDAQGRVWQSAWTRTESPGSVIHRWDGEHSTRHARRPGNLQLACTLDDDGTLWMAWGPELLVVGPRDDLPRVQTRLPLESVTPRGVVADAQGLAVLFAEGQLCRSVDGVGWTCAILENNASMRHLARGPDGRLWAGTESSGLLIEQDGAWRPALPPGVLRDQRVGRLTPSLEGMWIATRFERVRVDEVDDELRVVERLGEASGVPNWAGYGVYEQANGDLWLPTQLGPVHVPRSARRGESEPPPVRLASVAVNGRRTERTERFDLPAGVQSFDLSFSTFAYRDLEQLSYRMRLGPDQSWRAMAGPAVQLVNLGAGSYELEVQASVDQKRWSGVPGSVSFSVARFWYARPWVWLALTMVGALTTWCAYRLRLAHLVRLEQQRVAIAMDLHDELGAGLGSLGILGGAIADGTGEPSRQRAIGERIARTAGQLGESVHDIIWSLKTRDARLERLAAQLEDRGRDFFASREVRFETVVPDLWPDSPMSLAVRRHVQRIGVEALHNAARHAQAGTVELGLAPDGRRWRLWVEDDGRGIDPSARRSAAGMGLKAMAHRAAEIGGEIEIAAGPRGGTRVELIFDPSGRRHRRRRNRAAATPDIPVEQTESTS